MATQSGLSRRRVGGGASAGDSTADISTSSSQNGSSLSTTPAPSFPTSPNGYGGTALEGSSKVAYDPRDLDGDAEDSKLPKLTILEEVLLLGLKDKQGYLSFWNDNISYALRGCIIIELALRKRIAMVRDPNRRRYPLPDRLVEVVDERLTGETILDEALKMIKSSEKMGVGSWIDLLSGETWNVMKIGFQLKQVRERLMKGLVDKGVLRTEKRNFLLFDMATHPVADARTKEDVVSRVVALLTMRTAAIPPQALAKEGIQNRYTRAVCLACASYAASVLENALQRLSFDAREAAFARCDDILAEFSTWPFGSVRADGSSGRKREGQGGGSENIAGLVREVKKEMGDPEDLHFEVVATVLEVFGRMDSLL
ncbi:GPP34-domain-containing protein [Calocera cornea HHB12733]|uniref:Vacuolar protein sorting-associated protein 74 n=1 Tax=Calocera cornea HHB12733 TaxID=1353952 RepID=A0A165CCM4_9BASI|nr:GPP34-domain-containing protein [Calocera cornea HHB12733]